MPVIEGGFGLIQTDSARRITVQREPALNLFENIAVVNRDQYARALGVYGDVILGRDLKGEFASFSTPKHLWSNRKNGCTWNPKGGIRMGLDSFPTCPIEYDGEQCPDAFYGTCFEKLFAPGNGVRDFYSTPEAQEVLFQMVKKINQGLGNSFFSLYNWANHPLIEQANTEGFYNVAVPEWEAYVDQMLSGECGGLITQLDELAARGTAGYTREVPVNPTTGAFSGTFVTLLEQLKADASTDLQTAMESGMDVNGVTRYPVVMVTPEIFDQYKSYIRSIAGTNELAYRYMLEGTDGTTSLMRNVLVYDNMPVVRWDAHIEFDKITGAKSHRMAIVAPGVFGVLHDVDNLAQWEGMGLMLEQSQMLKDKGKIYMSTTLRWGAAIADINFVAMARTVLQPN